MATRRSLEEVSQIVLLRGKFENFSEIKRQWKHKFTSEGPSVETNSVRLSASSRKEVYRPS